MPANALVMLSRSRARVSHAGSAVSEECVRTTRCLLPSRPKIAVELDLPKSTPLPRRGLRRHKVRADRVYPVVAVRVPRTRDRLLRRVSRLRRRGNVDPAYPISYTHLRAHET